MNKVTSVFYNTQLEKVGLLEALIQQYGAVEGCPLHDSIMKIKIYDIARDITSNLVNIQMDKLVEILANDNYVIEVYSLEVIDEDV